MVWLLRCRQSGAQKPTDTDSDAESDTEPAQTKTIIDKNKKMARDLFSTRYDGLMAALVATDTGGDQATAGPAADSEVLAAAVEIAEREIDALPGVKPRNRVSDESNATAVLTAKVNREKAKQRRTGAPATRRWCTGHWQWRGSTGCVSCGRRGCRR